MDPTPSESFREQVRLARENRLLTQLEPAN